MDSKYTLPRGIADPQEDLVKREQLGSSDYKRIIREMGLKVTSQRIAILQALNAGRAHVTAQEVFENIQDDHPEIGFATVYRLLRKMTEAGVVTEVRMGGLPARYELTPKGHHDHLTCNQCGKIVEFHDSTLEKYKESIAENHGFRLTRHVLELYADCTKKNCENLPK